MRVRVARPVVILITAALLSACSEGSGDGTPVGGASGSGTAAQGGAISGSGGMPSGGAGSGGGGASAGNASGAGGSSAGSAGAAAGAGAGGAAGSAGMSGSGGTPADDDRLAVPEDLPNTEQPGQEGGLTLVAFTLREGASALELYAAARNDGDTPACDPGMLTYFYDGAGQLVTSAGSVFSGGRPYRLDAGQGAIIPCIDPGEIAMAASTNLPEEIVIDELGSLEHAFPAFTVPDIVPLDAFSVVDLETVPGASGTAYRGTLVNELDVPVSNPSITVFPLNRVGRPLGMTKFQAMLEVPAAGSWPFETDPLPDPGVARVAYPAATIVF